MNRLPWASVFIRGIALVYFIAFLSLIPQVRGLIGSDGILPASSYLKAVHDQLAIESYWTLPTLAWINSSDAFLLFLCWAGIVLSCVLFAGFCPIPSLILLWILYLSITNIGQEFLLFQWDALLLEAGFVSMLLAPWGWRLRFQNGPSIYAWWALRVLIFRLMLESGLAKLRSGDPTWRNLTALNYHYETQPLPTVPAWYAHHLPSAIHQISVAGMFFVELIVPFFFLVPYRRLRIAAAGLTILLQLAIAATGNYTFFNLLTIILCISLFADMPNVPLKISFKSLAAATLIAIGALQLILPAPLTIIDAEFEIWHIVNRYGLFAVMTTSRQEIIVEGSDDGVEWKAYEFNFKPGDVRQPPRWAAPYQPRLDWQMWFAALSNYRDTPWFTQFMLRLLQGSPEVLALVKTNPFPGRPPRLVRASIYDYHFSDPLTRRETQAWWTREARGLYFPPIRLQ